MPGVDYRSSDAAVQLELLPRAPLTWLASACLLTAICLHAITFFFWRVASPVGVDLNVYRAGGEVVINGLPLYAGPVTYTNLFTYPPFAALLFVPLTAVPVVPLAAVVTVAHVGLVTVAIWKCARCLGYATSRELWMTSLALTGFALWLEPVWITVALGQINVLLLVLILWDGFLPASSRWKGVGIGLAVGVKLTPLIFVVYLVLTRQFRAARNAIATFLGTVAVGFLVLPTDAVSYWTSTFLKSNRIGDIASLSNQSAAGALARFTGEQTAPTVLWLTIAGLLGLAGMLIAVWAHRSGETLLAMTLVGLTACAISPFSWDHHWVWLLPLILWLIHKYWSTGYRPAAAAAIAIYLLAFCWFAKLTPFGGRKEPGKGLFWLSTWDWLAPITNNIVLWLFVTALAISAGYLRASRQRLANTPRPTSPGGAQRNCRPGTSFG